MSAGFFYILGQGVTYISGSWTISASINLAVVLSVLLINGGESFNVVSVLAGCLSVIFLPEYLLGVTAIVFSTKASNQLLVLIYTIEVFAFAFVSVLVYADDSNPALWGIMAICHIIYVVAVETINAYSGRVAHSTLSTITWRYYVLFAIILCFTDLAFVCVTLINDQKPISPIAICVVALITLLLPFTSQLSKESPPPPVDLEARQFS